MTRTVSRRLDRLEARCAPVNPIKRQPPTIVFCYVDTDKRVTSAMRWDAGEKTWIRLEQEELSRAGLS
jgi:hypothetical protein